MLKKHFKFFRKLQEAKKSDKDSEPINVKQPKNVNNPQIKELCRAFYALTTVPITTVAHSIQKSKREINYFLDRRKLQIKGLIIVLVFSMAGLILMEIRRLLTEIGYLSKSLTSHIVIPWLSNNFHYNLFTPLFFALVETFLAFWLINSVHKLNLWFNREWTDLLEETFSREGE
jgi:hypothetical protein